MKTSNEGLRILNAFLLWLAGYKTSFLRGALLLAAVCVTQSFACVIGYINTPCPPGDSLIAVQLTTDNRLNRINDLWPPPQPLFNGCSVFKIGANGFESCNYLDGWSQPDMRLNVGGGCFFRSAATTNIIVTVTGTVAEDTNTIPAGISLCSCYSPVSGLLTSTLQFPTSNGDMVYLFNSTTTNYDVYVFSDGWQPAEPMIDVGQSFLVVKGTPGHWFIAVDIGTPCNPPLTSPEPIYSTAPQLNFFTFNPAPGFGRVFDLDGTTPVTSEYAGQLYVGTTNDPHLFVQLGTPAQFSGGAGGGYINSGTVSISPFATGPQPVFAQLRVWRLADGPTFELAALNGGRVGLSQVMSLTARAALESGQPGVPPPNANTFPSFSVFQAPLLQMAGPGAATDNFRAQVLGPPLGRYIIDVTTNLSAWTPLWTNYLSASGLDLFSEPVQADAQVRFYRARIQ